MNAILNLKDLVGAPVYEDDELVDIEQEVESERDYEFAFPSEDFETVEEYFEMIQRILENNGLFFEVSVHANHIDFRSEPQQGTEGSEYSIIARLTGDADTLAIVSGNNTL